MTSRPVCAAAALLLAMVGLNASPVSAETLSRHVSGAFEGGVVRLGGELAPVTSNGMRLGVRQGMQFGLVGFSLGIGSDVFLTRQPPPTRIQGLRLLHLSGGPRLSWALGPVRLLGGVEFLRVTALQNPVADQFGPEINRNGVGLAVGARWESGGLLFAELGGRSEWLFSRRGASSGWVATFSLGVLSAF